LREEKGEGDEKERKRGKREGGRSEEGVV